MVQASTLRRYRQAISTFLCCLVLFLFLVIGVEPYCTPGLFDGRWTDFWPMFNGVVLALTLLVLSYYTYETYRLRLAATKGNILALRPIIILANVGGTFGGENKGIGPALNVSLFVSAKGQIRVSPLDKVRSVMSPGEECQFALTDAQDASLGNLGKRYDLLIKKLRCEESALVFVYAGVEGTWYYSYYDLSTEQIYGSMLRHGELDGGNVRAL